MGLERNVCQSQISLNAGTGEVNLINADCCLELIAAKTDVVGCTIGAVTAFVAGSQEF